MRDILLSDLFIEILGAVTGLIYLFFSIRQNIWLWPWGIVTALLYIYVFYHGKLYANMGLQFYYLVISIYGWHFWTADNKKLGEVKVPVVRASWKEIFVFILIIILLSIITGIGLQSYSDSRFPYRDAFIMAGSIVTTWMLTRKYLEQWLFWIVIDAVAMITYLQDKLYPTLILFTVYTIMAFIGFYEWRKDWLKNSEI
jgi:nicotinamide mononucleotide transporter